MAKKRKLISEGVYPHLKDPTQCQARYSLLLYLAGLELFVHLLGNRGSDGMFFSIFRSCFQCCCFLPQGSQGVAIQPNFNGSSTFGTTKTCPDTGVIRVSECLIIVPGQEAI